VSESDNFINEVTDAVRRDRLYRTMRRYGWIAIAAVVLLVGAAAYTEWRRAEREEAARQTGDALLAALQPEAAGEAGTGPEQLAALAAEAEGEKARAITTFIAAAERQEQGRTGGIEAAREAQAEAASMLEALATDESLPPLYADLAVLKAVMLRGDSLDPAERIARLEPIAVPGRPYALLASEQIALAEIAAGAPDAARERLQGIAQDAGASASLRRRAAQLITALGEAGASE